MLKLTNYFKASLITIAIVAIAVTFITINLPESGSKKPLIATPKTNVVEKTCPNGFVLVSGSKLYGKNDFCVMKYDAKCANTSSPNLGLAPMPGNKCSGLSVTGGYAGVYKNNGPDCGCTALNGKKLVSTASGFPITYIAMSDKTPNNAKAYCQNSGWHLITNNEWMTIARNVETVNANWCDKNGTGCGNLPGALGKILASGHNDALNEPNASAGSVGALIAGNDNQPCFGTTTDGSNTCGGKNSQKRTLTLTNGNIIWDFAGNVWQWVDAQVQRKNEPESSSSGILDLGWTRSDFAPGSLESVIYNNGQGRVLNYDAFRPSNSTWNANNGVGRIYHYSNPNDKSTTFYAFIRGGNWRHFDDDGAFTIHMSPPAYTENIDDVGFRCVSAPL